MRSFLSDDPRGKDLFKALAADEQSHVEFLEYSLDYASGNGYWFNFMEIDMED